MRDPRRFTGAERAELWDRLTAGESIPKIAASFHAIRAPSGRSCDRPVACVRRSELVRSGPTAWTNARDLPRAAASRTSAFCGRWHDRREISGPQDEDHRSHRRRSARVLSVLAILQMPIRRRSSSGRS